MKCEGCRGGVVGGTELKHENHIALYTIICVQAESLIALEHKSVAVDLLLDVTLC